MIEADAPVAPKQIVLFDKLITSRKSRITLFVFFKEDLPPCVFGFCLGLTEDSRMDRESIDEGQISTPLLVNRKGQSNHAAVDDGGRARCSGTSSATAAVVFSTLVAVLGSYVFGSAVRVLLSTSAHSSLFPR